jgi:hypothetical protein
MLVNEDQCIGLDSSRILLMQELLQKNVAQSLSSAQNLEQEELHSLHDNEDGMVCCVCSTGCDEESSSLSSSRS